MTVCISGQNESRVKKCTLERLLLEAKDYKYAANNKFETFLHKVGPIFFSVFVGVPLLEAQIFGKFARKISVFGV